MQVDALTLSDAVGNAAVMEVSHAVMDVRDIDSRTGILRSTSVAAIKSTILC